MLPNQQLYASLWMIFSALLYSLQNVAALFSGDIFGFWTLCVFRGMVGSVLCLLWARGHVLTTGGHQKFLIIRSVLGGATIISLFFSILKCGLPTTTIITSTSSLWTAGIGYWISPERYKWSLLDLFLAVWCIGGIAVLLSGGHEGDVYYIGVLCAFLSAICQSGVNLTIRNMDDEPASRVAFWGMMGSVVLGMPGCIYELSTSTDLYFPRASTIDVVSLLATGVLSAMGQYYKTYSIQISSSMSVLILRHMEIVFSVIWDILFFQKTLSWRIITGVCIILSGCLLKLINKKPSPPPTLPQ